MYYYFVFISHQSIKCYFIHSHTLMISFLILFLINNIKLSSKTLSLHLSLFLKINFHSICSKIFCPIMLFFKLKTFIINDKLISDKKLNKLVIRNCWGRTTCMIFYFTIINFLYQKIFSIVLLIYKRINHFKWE